MAKGATVWWIEEQTGELCSHHFHSVPNIGSFEAEVRIKHADKPIDFLHVPDDRPDQMVWLEQMKEKSARMKQEIADSKMR